MYKPVRHVLSHHERLSLRTRKKPWSTILEKGILIYPMVNLTTALLRILNVYEHKQTN